MRAYFTKFSTAQRVQVALRGMGLICILRPIDGGYRLSW